MISFFGKIFASVAFGISSLFGGHAVPPTQITASSTVAVSSTTTANTHTVKTTAATQQPVPPVISAKPTPAPVQTNVVPEVTQPAPQVIPEPAVFSQPTETPPAPSEAEIQQQKLLENRQAILTALDKKIDDLQSQSDSCLNEMTKDVHFQQGSVQVAQQVRAAQCQNITSELNDFLTERQVVQQGGNITYQCSQNISSLEQKIYVLRQNVANSVAGIYSAPTSARIMQGRAQQAIQTEAAQEAPLLQQVQQNLYSCQ